MEKQIISLNGQAILLIIRRHKAARRVSLRLTPAGDGVVMTLPMRASLPRAMRFLQQKAGWVLSHVTKSPGKIPLAEGATLTIFGQVYVVERLPGRGTAKLQDGKLQLHGAPEFTARRIKDFLKKALQEKCLPHAQAMAKQLGKNLRSLRAGEMQSRWGSCTASGTVALNWRLAFAPPEVLTYLIAHEVAHLAEMNHSSRFWKHVSELCPDYKAQRDWLRREGQTLYRYE